MNIADANTGVLYATVLHSNSSKVVLESAMTAFLAIAEDGGGKLLYNLYYEQERPKESGKTDPLDLAFNDGMLEY
jgi:hypothetical protein